jgi:hypothetical protein
VQEPSYTFSHPCDIAIVDCPYGLNLADWDKEAWKEQHFKKFFDNLIKAPFMATKFCVCLYISQQQVRKIQVQTFFIHHCSYW